MRVDVVLLDKLMNLVGELVLARNQILQFSRTASATRRSCGATCASAFLVTSPRSCRKAS
jgi:two-component system chemotaxis sensor kinase CheA